MRIRLPVVLRMAGPAVAIGLILLASWVSGGDTWILIRALINLVELAIIVITLLLVLRFLTKLAAETYARERFRLEERRKRED